jgi:predicted enzyme related to lactoylglutathione lyase
MTRRPHNTAIETGLTAPGYHVGEFHCCWQKGESEMSEQSYTHGAFGWFELMTTNVQAAKDFYKSLFGWEYERFQGPMEYEVIQVAGKGVAGIMPMPPTVPPGTPPHWGIYIVVNDADQTVQQAKGLGGKIFAGPQDIPDVGRFAVIQDPQGATICILQLAMK